jgi:hypothetical protein
MYIGNDNSLVNNANIGTAHYLTLVLKILINHTSLQPFLPNKLLCLFYSTPWVIEKATNKYFYLRSIYQAGIESVFLYEKTRGIVNNITYLWRMFCTHGDKFYTCL